PFQKQPIAVRGRIDDRPVTNRRAKSCRRQHSSIRFNLAQRIVKELGLGPAHVLRQGTPTQVLEENPEDRAVVQFHIQFFNRKTGAVRRWSTWQPGKSATTAEVTAQRVRHGDAKFVRRNSRFDWLLRRLHYATPTDRSNLVRTLSESKYSSARPRAARAWRG